MDTTSGKECGSYGHVVTESPQRAEEWQKQDVRSVKMLLVAFVPTGGNP